MNLGRLLVRAIELGVEGLQVYAVTPHVCELRRKNGKREASVTVSVPDETIVNLRGEVGRRDLLLFIRIPREVVERLETPIILPGIDSVRPARVGRSRQRSEVVGVPV